MVVDNIDTVLLTVTMAADAGGIGLWSTVFAVPAITALEETAAFTGLLRLIGNSLHLKRRNTKKLKQ